MKSCWHSGLVDAVIIATRNDLHCPLTLAALERGLHVLCEKPLGLTYAEAAQMAACCRRQGRHLHDALHLPLHARRRAI